jgi:alpha-tubulin suppressor-like RCC1 family protein
MVATKTNNTLWSWGANGNGELGLNDRTSRSSPVQIGALTDWAYAYAGFSHVLAIKTNGTLWAWGINSTGELGQGGTTNRSSPVQVGSLTTWYAAAAGSARSFGITKN